MTRRSTVMWSEPNAVPQLAIAVVMPGQMARHHVGVALDDDDAVIARDVALGEIEPVEHLRLAVDRRLGGVEVLRPLVVVVELARTEADHLARHVADRPDRAPAEPVVHAALSLRDEPGGAQLLVGEARACAARRAGSTSPWARSRRRSAQRRRHRTRARRGIVGRVLGLGGRELRAEELRGGAVRGVQARAAGRLGRRSPVLVVQRVPDAAGEPFDGLGERHVVHRAEERVDVAGLVAAEAVVEARLRAHVEARAALVVERAQALHRADAGGLERDPLADDVGDVGARLHLVDVGLPDAPGHQRSDARSCGEAAGAMHRVPRRRGMPRPPRRRGVRATRSRADR